MQKSFFSPPSIQLLLSQNFWECHEVAYILTKWPENLIAVGIPRQISDRLGLRRIAFCVPDTRLNPKKLGAQFQKVLSEIKHSIASGELPAVAENLFLGNCYGKNVTYLISAQEVILWALLKGITLPENLSKAINIYQLNDVKLPKYSHQRVKNQVIGQYLLGINPNLNVSELCKHDWMRRFGTVKESNDEELKMVRRALNDLFDSQGSRGRPLKEQKKGRQYVYRPIREIIQKDFDGIMRICFPLFKTAIEIAIKIKMEILGRGCLFKMTENEFALEFFEEALVKSYTEGGSEFLMEMIKRFCREALERIYNHPRIQYLSPEIRNSSTIGLLYALHIKLLQDDMPLEGLSEEDKKSMESYFTEMNKSILL